MEGVPPPATRSKAFRIAAGKTATVTVKPKKSARKALKQSKVTLSITGSDSSGGRIAVRQSLRLLRAKGWQEQ